MRRRERVSAALHSELTEYASLLRALRASHTLDLSQHILKPPPYTEHEDTEQNNLEDINMDDEEDTAGDTSNVSQVPSRSSSTYGSRSCTPSTRASSVQAPGPSKKRKRTRLSDGNRPMKSRQRNLWARWPLLLKDVSVPEWTLGDEVTQITETLLRKQRLDNTPQASCATSHSGSRSPLHARGENRSPSEESVPSSSSDDPHGESDVDEEVERYAPHLTHAASNYLSAILAHLVANTPKRPPSQQNRVVPIDWHFLLDTLCSSTNPELADPEIIQRVRTQLEELYGSEDKEQFDSTAKRDALFQHRMERRLSGKERRRTKLEKSLAVDSILTY